MKQKEKSSLKQMVPELRFPEFANAGGWGREEEINHRKHRKTRKGERSFSVLFRDFRGSEILELANFVLGDIV
jgi:hypothetical protein